MATIFRFDEFELDTDALELRRAGVTLKVDALVLRLLACLVRHAGSLVTKEEIVAEVWQGRAVADNVLTVSMARLRKALDCGRDGREIVATVYGRGYRFVRDVTAARPPHALARGPGIAAPAEPPLVGRERALQRLRDAFARARGGRGGMCAVIGEPGIGKTRLVEALHGELAGSGVAFAWGFCREAGGTPPLWPWLRVLRELRAAHGEAELERELGARAAAEVDALLQAPTAQPGAERDASGGPQPARFARLDAVRRALALAATRAPLVLVLDDLHAADAASIELLDLLIDELARLRILVIATLRPGEGGRAPRAETRLPRAIAHRNCERIALPPLGAREVAEYVAALVPDHDGGRAGAVDDNTDGKP
jgi:DNA-binding winged helix-turn-helix (wHTH) protein